MLLRNVSPASSIDSVFFTSDATSGGYAAGVDWLDWWRMKKMHSVETALDTTPVVYTTGQGAKGAITLEIGWCPASLWNALKTFVDGTAHHTATLKHPQLGTKVYDVQCLSLIAASDEQWETGDPIEKATLRLVSFGAI